jgi:hypothetical protein
MMESPRFAAARAGQNKYVGKPCPKCGGTLRYVINAGCVACLKKIKSISQEKLRQQILDAKATAA